MKKTITLMIAMVFSILAMAQRPVSQVAGKKQALLEEFTGNTCGYCPDGAKRSDAILAANPGKAFVVAIHAGSYATPSSNSASKDFRTTDGNGIAGMSGMSITGFPAGAVNRRVPVSGSPQSSGGMAMSRSYWASNVASYINENTYVNIAGDAYLHPNTRVMTVYLEAYYTGNAPSNISPKISLALTQSNIIAYQSGGSSYYPAMLQTPGNNATYKHNHALRDIITAGATGESMGGSTTSGYKWTKSYTYTVAATIPSSGTKAIPLVLNDLELIAYITETTKNVVAVAEIPVHITTDIQEQNELVSFANVYPTPMSNQGVAVFTLSEPTNVNITIVNSLGQLVNSENLGKISNGEHKFVIDAANLSDGIYFLNINAGETVITKKISVLK